MNEQINHLPEARLIDLKNVTGKQVFQLTKLKTRIGRAAGNDFIILKSTISGSHAQIEYRDDAFYLIDFNSTNKTQLNGEVLKPRSPVRLEDGDQIMFDVFKFIYIVEDKPPASIEVDAKPGKRAGKPGSGKKRDAGKPHDDADDEELHKTIGKYTTVAKLGKGGFGIVWEARDPKGRTVAIKLLNPENLEDERAVRKFFHEAIILSHLDHPNITKFIDFFPKDSNYAIVMDFVEGSELKTLLEKQKGPLPFDQACKIAGQVLDAFQYAHEKRILHRDIKPENIIFDTNGNAKIMDFGIAKMSTAATQKTAFRMISPLYTPPERFDKSSEPDVRSDIYSLGLVFYEIFTGKHPFEESNISKIIFSHINKLPEPPEQFASIPHGMSQSILKSLEKDPKDRFQDFAEFKNALLGHQGNATVEPVSRPVESRPPEPVPEKDSMVVDERQDEVLPPKMEGLIEFSPDVSQVGAAVMHYFLEVLNKFPKRKTSFSVIQDGQKLTLLIRTVDGRQKIIEKDLEQLRKSSRIRSTSRKSTR